MAPWTAAGNRGTSANKSSPETPFIPLDPLCVVPPKKWSFLSITCASVDFIARRTHQFGYSEYLRGTEGVRHSGWSRSHGLGAARLSWLAAFSDRLLRRAGSRQTPQATSSLPAARLSANPAPDALEPARRHSNFTGLTGNVRPMPHQNQPFLPLFGAGPLERGRWCPLPIFSRKRPIRY